MFGGTGFPWDECSDKRKTVQSMFSDVIVLCETVAQERKITELQIQSSFQKVLMSPLFLCLYRSDIHLKMDCSVTWTNTLLRAAINTFCQKLQAVPDMPSITIYIKQRAFYDFQSKAGRAALILLMIKTICFRGPKRHWLHCRPTCVPKSQTNCYSLANSRQ